MRRLLVLGGKSLVRSAQRKPEKAAWISGLLAPRPAPVAIVAVANKLARIAWAVLSRGDEFRHSPTSGSTLREAGCGIAQAAVRGRLWICRFAWATLRVVHISTAASTVTKAPLWQDTKT